MEDIGDYVEAWISFRRATQKLVGPEVKVDDDFLHDLVDALGEGQHPLRSEALRGVCHARGFMYSEDLKKFVKFTRV